MKSAVVHRGVVTKAIDGKITVKISPDVNECDGCAISAMCTKSEEVIIPYEGEADSLIGKEVTISAPIALQRSAVLIFFAIPIAILLIVMLLSISLGSDELSAGIISIASVAIWYTAVWLYNSRNSKGTRFTLDETKD